MFNTFRNIICLSLITSSAVAELQCFVEGQCLNSPILDITLQEDANACLKHCQEDPTCRWFTFDDAVDLCELFETCPTLSDDQCDQCVSGENTCEPQPTYMCGMTGFCEVKKPGRACHDKHLTIYFKTGQ